MYASQISRKKTAKLSTEKKNELNNAVLNCIIKDGLSISVFSKPGMKEFLSKAVPGYTPPHRVTIAKHIGSSYKHYRNQLKKYFSDIDYLALTSDFWKNRSNSHYLILTAHFLDEDFKLLSIIISFRNFNGQHLAKRIVKFVDYELIKLNINDKVVQTSTTDNAGDMKKSFKERGTWISCMCHNLNLICQGVFNGKKLKQLANSSKNQIDVENIINELTSESESESEPQDDSADESINND